MRTLELTAQQQVVFLSTNYLDDKLFYNTNTSFQKANSIPFLKTGLFELLKNCGNISINFDSNFGFLIVI